MRSKESRVLALEDIRISEMMQDLHSLHRIPEAREKETDIQKSIHFVCIFLEEMLNSQCLLLLHRRTARREGPQQMSVLLSLSLPFTLSPSTRRESKPPEP